MLINTQDDIKSSEITSERIYSKRRELIKALGLAPLSLAAMQAPLAVAAKIKSNVNSKYTLEESLTSLEDISGYCNFYEFGTAKEDPARNAHTLITDPWSVTVGGAAEVTGTFNIEDLLKGVAREERVYRMRCVEAWSMVIPWVGVPLASVIKRFKPTSAAKYVSFETLHDVKQMPGQRRRVIPWPYREGLRMDEAMNPLTLLATGIYGEDLLNQNGAPLRLVIPWKYGFKGIKSIVKIHFTENKPENSWNTIAANEYGFYANVNPEVDHPRWSQATERRIGEGWGFYNPRRETLMFNGYAEQVAHMYSDMDLTRHF